MNKKFAVVMLTSFALNMFGQGGPSFASRLRSADSEMKKAARVTMKDYKKNAVTQVIQGATRMGLKELLEKYNLRFRGDSYLIAALTSVSMHCVHSEDDTYEKLGSVALGGIAAEAYSQRAVRLGNWAVTKTKFQRPSWAQGAVADVVCDAAKATVDVALRALVQNTTAAAARTLLGETI